MANFDYINHSSYLRDKAAGISDSVFLGGGLEKFEQAGRGQLISLLQVGLYPHSRVLDIGCGCLRGGYWLIHFLNRNCYFGLEPNVQMLNAGIKHILEDEVLKEKQPQFDNNDRYDFGCFNTKFDFIIARSVWTHAPKADIEKMLDGFMTNTTAKAVFLTTYLPTGFRGKEDYRGNTWVGKSHRSGKRGTIAHNFDWIRNQCGKRNLSVREPVLFEHGQQCWLYITRN